ncbi:MAG TPA: translocation/assembly module TamB domain-containing protein, partial [Polyangiaceae bacterium]
SFSVFPDGKLELEAEAKRVNLAKAERLRAYFEGSGYADMRVRAVLDRGRLDSKLTLEVRELAYQGASLKSGRLVASVRGPVERPEQLGLDLKLTGKGLTGGGVGFDDVEVTARGALLAPNVTASLSGENGPSVDAQATVALANPVSIRELTLGVQRNGVEVRAFVAQLDLGAERVVLRDFQLRGASGQLKGDAKLDHGELAVTAHGKDVDLSAFSRVLGLPRGTFEGLLSLDVAILADRRTQSGNVDLSLRQGSFAQLGGVSGQLRAKLDGERLTGDLNGKVETLGSFSAGWDTRLAGRPVNRAAFEQATGTAKLALKDVTLEYLGQLMPDANVDVGGTASASLELSRQDGRAVPDLEASVETHDLHVTIAQPQGPAHEISRIELLSTLTHTGATGSTALSFGATRDGQRLLSSTTEMTLDLEAALDGREPLQAQVEQHPLLIKAIVSELQLDSLPDGLRQPGLRGTVRLEGTLRGTLREPTATLAVRAAGMRFAPGDRSEPIDLCATAEYAKASGAFTVGAEAFLPPGIDLRRGACTGKRIATARWSGLMPLGERGYVGWTGTLLGALENMPLAVIPPLAKAGVTGTIDGRMLLDRSGAQPSASVELALKGVKVDELVVGDGSIGLRSSDKRARVEFVLRHGGSALEGQLNAGLLWPTDVPEIDSAQPIDVSVRASHLQASVLEPFVEGALGELGGILDINLNARLDALTPGKTERTLDNIDGRISLKDGAFLLTGLGFRLRDVDFTATATRDGKLTLIEIPAFAASANARTRNMSAFVRLQLQGLSLEGGQARVSLTNLPLVIDGVTRANADARFSIDLQRKPEKMLTQITFEKLQAKLLKESTRELVELKEHPNVVVLQPLAEPKARRDEDAIPWHFVIHLGENAKVVRTGMLDVTLTGDPNVVLAQELGVTGAIHLRRGGAVQMLGKIFLIEGGGVFFDSADAADPRLDVQASWRAPDGDTLFLFVTGTASKPKLRFDRPDEQAWAMLLGGDASDITTAALDTLLADTPLAGVSVRKSSAEDDEQGATYTASYRLGEKIIVEGNYQEAQSTGAYQTEAGVGAAVDWRMTKSWSLRGQLGTIGTGVDLLYQYRY